MSTFIAFVLTAHGWSMIREPMPTLTCLTAVQAVEDGQPVHLTDEAGRQSPPLVIALCVDPEKRVSGL